MKKLNLNIRLYVSFLLSFFIILSSCKRNNPKGDLTGNVFYANTTIPIQGVQVKVGDIADESEDDGSYLLKNLDEGENQLMAVKSGFDSYSSVISIIDGPNTHNIGMSSSQNTGKIFGHILGERTKTPKTGLQVLLVNPDFSMSTISSITDASGFYELLGVPRGLRTISVRDGEDVLVEEELVLNEAELELNFPLHEPVIDPRDGKEYSYLIIGQQVWMGENMNFALNDGDGSWCYQDDPASCEEYGRLYNWETAMEVCPEGWHVPSDEEWQILEISLGMDPEEAKIGGWRLSGNVGYKMKSATGWENDGNGDNSSGFNIKPGAGRRVDGLYDLLGKDAGFWSSTELDPENAWGRGFGFDKDGVFRHYSLKHLSVSVRCIQD